MKSCEKILVRHKFSHDLIFRDSGIRTTTLWHHCFDKWNHEGAVSIDNYVSRWCIYSAWSVSLHVPPIWAGFVPHVARCDLLPAVGVMEESYKASSSTPSRRPSVKVTWSLARHAQVEWELILVVLDPKQRLNPVHQCPAAKMKYRRPSPGKGEPWGWS